MDKFLGNLICIDWGFTHLKLFAFDKDKNILEKELLKTSEIVSNNKFYSDTDLSKVKIIISNFLKKHSNPEGLKLYTCSQMHGIAGVLFSGESFFSTWNDMPLRKTNYSEINAVDGIPLLSSMPSKKIRLRNNKLYLESYGSKQIYKKKSIEISKLSSPLSIILFKIFGKKMPCSNSWWQSTTINKVDKNIKENIINIIERPLTIKDFLLGKRLYKKVIIYPEQGDLQASVYGSIDEADIIINTGTGSQLIFPKKLSSTKIKYFRFFPKKGNIPVLSHIPCGRIFDLFSESKNLGLKVLIKNLSQNRKKANKDEIHSLSKSLLFFPGYCTKEQKYKNIHINLKGLISLISFNDLIHYWLDQYVKTINLNFSKESNDPIKLHILGDLGGIVSLSIPIIEKKLGNRYQITHHNPSIINAFQKMF